MNWNGCHGTISGSAGDPVNSAPSSNPYAPTPLPGVYHNPYPQPGSIGFGMDPNPAFTAAINRLAAALEKFNDRASPPEYNYQAPTEDPA